ncbi:MAG: hypothetical protein VX433_05010 [Candidatus Thermoplasmatota archaeon]|nr:hypothetical protein [Candidatus Thermoplasmatota archaeon]
MSRDKLVGAIRRISLFKEIQFRRPGIEVKPQNLQPEPEETVLETFKRTILVPRDGSNIQIYDRRGNIVTQERSELYVSQVLFAIIG